MVAGRAPLSSLRERNSSKASSKEIFGPALIQSETEAVCSPRDIFLHCKNILVHVQILYIDEFASLKFGAQTRIDCAKINAQYY